MNGTQRRVAVGKMLRRAGLMLALTPVFAQAYVGPGVGLSALGSILAFIGAIVLLIAGFLWYPIKRLLRGRSKSAGEATGAEVSDKQKDTES